MEDSHNSNSSHNNSHSSSSSDEIETEVEKKRKKLKTEKLNLTLDNFDGDDIPDDYPYVLTSPRSLAACKHFGVRPVDLLPFRIEDARRQLEQEGDYSFEALTLLREAEEERREILERCRQLRDEWIKEDEERFGSGSSKETPGDKDVEGVKQLTEEQDDNPSEGAEDLDVDDDDDDQLSDDVFETRSEAEERRRKDNLLSQPLLKLSDGAKTLLDNHLESQSGSSGRNCSSPYTSSDRPEADQSFEEGDNSGDEFQRISSSDSESSCTSGRSSRSGSSLDRLNSENSFRLKKSSKYLDLSSFTRDSDNSEPSSRSPSRDRSSHVTFCDQPTLVVVSAGKRTSSSGISDRVFRNPYGPPLYFHSRPIVMNPTVTASNNLNNNNNSSSSNNNCNSSNNQIKKKARRIRRLQTSNLKIAPALKTSQIIDVDDDPEQEPPSCCQRLSRDEEKKSSEGFGANFRWKQRSSSTFKPSERTSRMMESANAKLENANKISTIILNQGNEVDLETLDLPNHDKKILERLHWKRERQKAEEDLAHVKHIFWREEMEHREKEKAIFDLFWKRKIEQKRMQESVFNEQRLLEARKLFLESQDLLRRLIKEKDDRARQFVHEVQRRKVENNAEWRAAEEARRLAVETALEELLARDTQYRKELNSHIESRILQAEYRRRSQQEKLREDLAALNEFNSERQRRRLSNLERDRLENILTVRQEIERRLKKVSDLTKENRLRWRDKTIHQLRMERALRSEKARTLKAELDAALDKWRKQVLEVQSKSIREAEDRARLILSQRKIRAASEFRERRERHEEVRQKVRQNDETVESRKWKSIEDRKSKFEKWSEEKNLAIERSRRLAETSAALRQAIRNQTCPDTFDKRAARVNIEAKVTQLKESFV